ncbi:MAG: hypothetical protein ACR2JE_02745 [Acidobacteriaceae bacterium]
MQKISSAKFVSWFWSRRTFKLLATFLAVTGSLAFTAAARGDIGVLLASPTGIGVSAYTNSGHSGVYFSDVCPASPVRLRMCAPGEQGSVLNAYPDYFEAKRYEWNIVPLSQYLFGTTSRGDALLYASHPLKNALESFAREHYLAPVCGGATVCPTVEHAYWRDLTAATMVRDIYIFAARSTRAQDQEFVDWWNAQPNVNRYRSLTYNCANFTQEIVNRIYPHSTHRDLLNDLGMMGPKAAARSFSRYTMRHPEMGFYVRHFVQQPSALPRSGIARSGTEAGFHQKKYLLPAALIGDHEVAGSFFVSYFLTGRFSLAHTFRDHPSPAVASLIEQEPVTGHAGGREQAAQLKEELQQARATAVGSAQQWAAYRERFNVIREDAARVNIIHEREDPRHIFRSFDAQGLPAIDPRDGAWIVFRSGGTQQRAGTERRVGVDRSNILAPESDRRLAYRLMLARIGYVLHSKPDQRETLPNFEQDWAILDQLHAELQVRRDNHLLAQTAPSSASKPASLASGAGH